MPQIAEKDIEILQERISKLRSESYALKENLPVLEKICKGLFLSNAEGKVLLRNIAHILEEQDEMLTCCQKLRIKEIPTTYDELSKQLKEQLEQFSQQHKYEDALMFLKSLRSNQPEQQKALATYQSSLISWGNPELTSDRYQSILEDCDILQRGLAETLVREKYALSLKIANRFGPEIAQGVNFNEITVVPADTVPVDLLPTSQSAWEDLGIHNPASIAVNVDAVLRCAPAQNNKPFGVKIFKRDLSTYDSKAKKRILKLIWYLSCVTPEVAAAIFGEDVKVYRSACEKLQASGYLTQYDLEGIGCFYIPSSKGQKIFKTKEAAEFIHCPHYKGELPNLIEVSKNMALACIMLLRIPVYLQNAIGEVLQLPFTNLLENNSFLFTIHPLKANKEQYSLCYLGTAGNTPKDFQQLQKYLEHLNEKNENIDILTLVGSDLPHAKALSHWVKSRFSDHLGDTPILYMDSQLNICYQLDNDDIWELSTFLDGADKSADVTYDSAAGTNTSACDVNKPVAHLDDTHNQLSDDADKPADLTYDSAAGTNMSACDVNKPVAHLDDTHNQLSDDADKPADLTYDSVAGTNTSACDVNKPVAVHLDDTHNQLSNDANKSTNGKVGSAISKKELEQHDTAINEMLVQKQFCCATTYLNTLAQNDLEIYKSRSQKLSYALNDPWAMCEYSSARIFDIYSDNLDTPDAYIISATLRNYFLNQCGYDYQLASLWDTIAKLPWLETNGALNQVIYKIKNFKSKHHRGIDFYADYRQKKREMFEQTISDIQAEAMALYENNVLAKVKERISQRRFLETKKIIFSPKSNLAECLDAVQQDNRDFLPLIEDFLSTYYIKDGECIDRSNIDTDKIENILTEAWAEAGNNIRLVKRSSDLMGRLHTNLSMQVRRVVTVLCDYVSTLSAHTLDENDSGLTEYRRMRDPLLQDLEQAHAFEIDNPMKSLEDRAAQTVLLTTLDELIQRLNGTYEDESNRYFYLPFLQSDQILLDENYMPEIQDISGISDFSVLERIRCHCATPHLSLEGRFWKIFNSDNRWGDDYGSARLILQYLKSHPNQVQNSELLSINPENIGFADPDAFLNNQQKDFVEYMELAQSYGQFDNSESDQKESMNQIVNVWCEQTRHTHNFDFFHRILDALRKKIQRDAKVREQDLLESLKAYQNANTDWEKQDLTKAAVEEILTRISVQNYTAAEDLLNRLNSKDLDTNGTINEPDYLQEFLKEYDVNTAKAGRAGGNLKANLAWEHNKDTRGGNRLITSWPKGTNTPPSTIKDLLMGLGFPVAGVKSAAPIQKRDHYLVTLNNEIDGHKNGYKHPISAFGSKAESDGFRVVNIFGRMDASRLIDMFRAIGDTKNTLILLDYALTLADRRTLARKVKTELFFEKTFAVLDRVALVYLARHYSETAINRMLMAVVMPFAADKLYQPDSAQYMPPELFIGRQDELRQIKDSTGVNIVYGGRQLGKTALLRKAQKDIDHNENGDRAIWVDIKYKDYRAAAKKISETLFDEGIFKTEHITEDWDELTRDLKNRLRETRDPIHYLLLLIDEADTFIDSCEAVHYHPFDALKDVQGVCAGQFKFVVAGLHNVVRFKRDITLRNNVGLTHLSSLTVTPFKYKEARELLEVPLSYLGFRFPDTPETARLISTIFTTTNYFPGLLQLYCTKLIENLQRSYGGYDEVDTPPYQLNETLIKRVLSDESLQREIRDKFEITIKVDEDDKRQDNYYYLVALLTAYCSHNTMQQKGVGADDIIQVAKDYEIHRLTSLSRTAVEVLMDEMQELNILKRLGNDRYRFARFNFLQMMGSVSEIEDKILEYSYNQET